jgi:Bacterial Ig-like domain (group 3)/FG-GAP-like repeat
LRIRPLLVCLAVLLPSIVTAGPVMFRNPRAIATGTSGHFAVADFDLDGNADFLTTNEGIRVHRGNGNGSFQPPVVTAFAFGPSAAFATGDVDNDGRVDLAAVLPQSAGIAILRNTGAGAFAQTATLTLGGAFPAALAFGDFTGDGKADLLVTPKYDSQTQRTVMLFPGAGNGTFGAVIPSVIAYDELTLVQAGDVNLDGKLDAVVGYSGARRILTGNGDGTFVQGGYQNHDRSLHAFQLGDLDADGDLDLVSFESTRVSVERNDGTGTFTLAARTPAITTVSDVAAADFNGDGRVDVAGAAGDREILVSGDGSGGFSITHWRGGMSRIGAADFDEDGKVDVIGTTTFDVLLIHGNGDGTLATDAMYNTARGTSTHYGMGILPFLAHADVTSDGIADAITVTESPAGEHLGIVVARGIAGGAFGEAIDTVTRTRHPYGGHVLGSGDLNGDGHLDVVLYNDTDGKAIDTYLGNGAGQFPTRVSTPVTEGGSGILRDFNGDGKLDVLASMYGIHFGNGDGTFTAPAGSPVPSPDLVADFNGDGFLDVFVGTTDPGTVYLGSANGTFTYRSSLERIERTLSAVAATDLNNDGHVDLVLEVHLSAIHLDVRLGNGDGTFTRMIRTPFNELIGIADVIADFDGDGNVDLFGNGAVLFGDGHGSFRGYARPRMLSGVAKAAAADVDGNGKLDLLVRGDYGETVLVLRTWLTNSREIPLAMAIGSVTPPGPTRHGEHVTVPVTSAHDTTYRVEGAFRITLGGRTIGLAVPSATGTASVFTSTDYPFATLGVEYLSNGMFEAQPLSQPHQTVKGTPSVSITGTDPPPPVDFGVRLRIGFAIGYPGLRKPTGTLTLREGDTVLHTMAVTEQQHAVTLARTFPSVGSHTYTLEYSGDAFFEPASTTFVQVIENIRPTVWLSSSPLPPIAAGSGFTLIASVGADFTNITGTMTFRHGATVLGAVPVTGTSTSLHLPGGLPAGSHELQVFYSGDANYQANASAPTWFTIVAPAGTPVLIDARAISSTTGLVTLFPPVAGATHYDVYISSGNGPFQLWGTFYRAGTEESTFTAGRTYRFYAVPKNASNQALATGPVDLMTMVAFTDPQLVAGQTIIKRVHLEQLQTAVNAVRFAANLPPVALRALAGQFIAASDVLQLRTALEAARSALGFSTTWTTPSLGTGFPIRATDVQDLRNAVN